MTFKPQKAKTYGKDNIKTHNRNYLVSTKYDGFQVFLTKTQGEVACYTSNWKPFSHSIFEKILSLIDEDNFILIGEFLHDSDGKLGSRSKSAILTTYRTNKAKGISNSPDDELLDKVIVFDCIFSNNFNLKASERLSKLKTLLKDADILQAIEVCSMTLPEALNHAKKLTTDGWEGVMCIDPDSTYHAGKRVHHAIKIKPRLTADLLCVNVLEGEGKYKNMIGSLVLMDKEGRLVNVGSGLTDNDRQLPDSHYINKVIEIEYERIDGTYTQPIFKIIRGDKTIHEID